MPTIVRLIVRFFEVTGLGAPSGESIALLTDGISVSVAEYIGTGGCSAKEVPSESNPRTVWNH
jgi:hypothetical protein